LSRFKKYDELVKGVGQEWMKKISLSGSQLMSWASAAREYCELATKIAQSKEDLTLQTEVKAETQVAQHPLPKHVHADAPHTVYIDLGQEQKPAVNDHVQDENLKSEIKE